MLRVCFSSLFALVLFAGSAQAQGNCIEPYAPVIPDGTTASEAQILSVQTQVLAFIRDSDSYQECLGVYIRQVTEEARTEREPVNTTFTTGMVRRIEANQREKERVGEEFNTAVRAFNAAQGQTPE